MGDVWPVPGGGGAASLLGTSPKQRKRSMTSVFRPVQASAGLRFPPLWETSGLSLAAVRLRLSWGRLRSSENAAYRRGFAEPKPPWALGVPPLWETSGLCLVAVRLRLSVRAGGVMCGVLCCVVLWCCVELCCVVCGVFCVPARRRCAIQNENPISRSTQHGGRM